MKLRIQNINQTGSLDFIAPALIVILIISLIGLKILGSSHASTPTTTSQTPLISTNVIYNVVYAHNSPLEKLDIYPSPRINSPTVVLVHGGGWIGGDKSDADVSSKASMLQFQGFTVFNIDYRLDSTTVAAFPWEINDIIVATQYAKTNAGKYNGNPAKLTLLGGSAGGLLVGMAAEKLNASSKGTVNTVITLSGATDFVNIVNDAKNHLLISNLVNETTLALSCPINSCTNTIETTWSPDYNITPSNCPADGWQIFNSQNELMPLDQPNAMLSALQKSGCKASLTIVPGNGHSFTYWPNVQSKIYSFIANQ